MSFIDAGYGPDLPTLSLSDEDLLTGASYGSNVTVKELVVVASRGGGHEQWADWQDYQYYYNQDPSGTGNFEQWAEEFERNANQFSNEHVEGDANLAVYQQARQAMTALYAAAKLADPATLWPTPNGTWLTQPNFLKSIEQTKIIIGTPPVSGYDAYTDNNGTMKIVYIDPTKLQDDISNFGEIKGINYTIYHELGHASVFGNNLSPSAPNREATINEYGQFFAEVVGAQYPTDTDLNQAGGTVPRH